MTDVFTPEAPLLEAPVSREVPTLIHAGGPRSVWFRRALPTGAPRARDGRAYGRQILPKGHLRRPGALPLPSEILFEPDVPVRLRDGTTIFTDVLRPPEDGHYPGIVSWGPFGKTIGGVRLDDFPDRVGIPLNATTELMKWEAVDPGYWVSHGYAVLHPDARGSYRSGGNIQYWGRQEGEDGYDLIEWAAGQPWSNGRLGMAGNSWLAISQWFIAAEKPPHLAAIAPWEGASDIMREFMLRGGIPQIPFPEALTQAFAGDRLIEDIVRMTITEPDFTDYWRDKRARFDQIEVPAYIAASYDNFLHTQGSFAAWREIASKDKWLRVHNTHEWPDLYDPANTEELRRFFDCYLKRVDDGWTNTPRVRLAMLDPAGEDEVGRVVETWPPAGYPHRTMYLTDAGMLSEASQPATSSDTYDVTDFPGAVFSTTISEESEILGYCKVKLWVEAVGADDMDLLVLLEKLGALGGEPLPRPNPYGAPAPLHAVGMLRVSRRALDEARSTTAEPFLKLQGAQPLSPGEIVPVEIGLWPIGLKLHPGETLRVIVAPFHSVPIPFQLGSAAIDIPADRYVFDPASPAKMTVLSGSTAMEPAWVREQAVPPDDRNAGSHRIHFGGRYDSHLLVPLRTIGGG